MQNIGNMLKQAQKMQEKLNKMQEGLMELTAEGTSGGGLVTVTLNGKNSMEALKIDPSLASEDEVEVLEDLIIAAFNDAKGKIETKMEEQMAEITGGMPLPPGFKMPF